MELTPFKGRVCIYFQRRILQKFTANIIYIFQLEHAAEYTHPRLVCTTSLVYNETNEMK